PALRPCQAKRPQAGTTDTTTTDPMPNTMTEHQEQNEEGVLVSTQDLEPSKHQDAQGGHPHFRLIDDLSYEDVKKCYRGSLCVRLRHAESGAAELSSSEREGVRWFAGGREASQGTAHDSALSLCSDCQQVQLAVPQTLPVRSEGRDPNESILLRSAPRHPATRPALHLQELVVAIPVVSVRLVKKHKTAGLVPNGLAITTDTSQKYVFVSLLSRDSVYDVLRRICTHLQVNGKKSLSLKHYMEVPHTLSLDEYPVTDEFPVADEYPPVLKWRRKPSVVSVSSSLPDLLGSSTGSLTAVDSSFQTDQPLEGENLAWTPIGLCCITDNSCFA
ncbi:unnamed protein product, partial [Coregonus sp. 'balchen']